MSELWNGNDSIVISRAVELNLLYKSFILKVTIRYRLGLRRVDDDAGP